jgi:negative regulator of sigma E activity
MTPERFRRITEAYGASPERWPRAERDAARALLDAREPEALAALADARALDGLLDAHAVAAPSDALARRIIASAPRRMPFWRRPRIWFSGVGFVGAGAAGIAAGALVVSLLAPAQLPQAPQAPQAAHGWVDQSYSGSVFGGASDDWSDQ